LLLRATTDTLQDTHVGPPLAPADPAKLCPLARRPADGGAGAATPTSGAEPVAPHRLQLAQADRLLWVWLARVWTEWRPVVPAKKLDLPKNRCADRGSDDALVRVKEATRRFSIKKSTLFSVMVRFVVGRFRPYCGSHAHGQS
jgi:hypothetical protein